MTASDAELAAVVAAVATDAFVGTCANGPVVATLYSIFSNIAAAPSDPKLRHLRKANARVSAVLAVPGGYEVLTAGGFEDHGDAMEMPTAVSGATAGAVAAALRPLVSPGELSHHAGDAHGHGIAAAEHKTAEDREYEERRAAAAEHAKEVAAKHAQEAAERAKLTAAHAAEQREFREQQKDHVLKDVLHELEFGAHEKVVRGPDIKGARKHADEGGQ